MLQGSPPRQSKLTIEFTPEKLYRRSVNWVPKSDVLWVTFSSSKNILAGHVDPHTLCFVLPPYSPSALTILSSHSCLTSSTFEGSEVSPAEASFLYASSLKSPRAT